MNYARRISKFLIPLLTGWTPVKNDVYIEADLENSPLEIKTDSSLGSNEKVKVGFYTSEELWVGELTIHFTSTPRYELHSCNNIRTNFLTNFPTDEIKVWKITLTRTSGIRSLVIQCNNNEILNILLSDTTCTDRRGRGSAGSGWDNGVEKIRFYQDTASDYYRGK